MRASSSSCERMLGRKITVQCAVCRSGESRDQSTLYQHELLRSDYSTCTHTYSSDTSPASNSNEQEPNSVLGAERPPLRLHRARSAHAWHRWTCDLSIAISSVRSLPVQTPIIHAPLFLMPHPAYSVQLYSREPPLRARMVSPGFQCCARSVCLASGHRRGGQRGGKRR